MKKLTDRMSTSRQTHFFDKESLHSYIMQLEKQPLAISKLKLLQRRSVVDIWQLASVMMSFRLYFASLVGTVSDSARWCAVYTVCLFFPATAEDIPDSPVISWHFTARCTLVQSAVLRSPVVCPSVCDVGELWSHRLEFFENNFTVS